MSFRTLNDSSISRVRYCIDRNTTVRRLVWKALAELQKNLGNLVHALTTTTDPSPDVAMDATLSGAPQTNGFGTGYGGATQVPGSSWGGASAVPGGQSNGWGASTSPEPQAWGAGWSGGQSSSYDGPTTGTMGWGASS
jgi:hypothetical protein